MDVSRRSCLENLKPHPLEQAAASGCGALLELASRAVGAQPQLELGYLRSRESVRTK
jgi:hypothetical protein